MIFLCCRHCGLRDPSWSELDNFVNFLAAQLGACTNSTYCDKNIVGDTLRGMKDFVVGKGRRGGKWRECGLGER